MKGGEGPLVVLRTAELLGSAGKRQSRQEPEDRASLPAQLCCPHCPGEKANRAGVRNSMFALVTYSCSTPSPPPLSPAFLPLP